MSFSPWVLSTPSLMTVKRTPFFGTVISLIWARPQNNPELPTIAARKCKPALDRVAGTRFILEEQNNFLFETGDIVYLRQLYDEICRLAGESLMGELNRRRFLIVSKVPAFAQRFTDDLISKLNWRARETSKQISQLLLDIIPGDSEGT